MNTSSCPAPLAPLYLGSASLTRARVALRWLVAGSAALRWLRRALRVVSWRGAALALVLATLALGTVACGVGMGTSTTTRDSVAARLTAHLRGDRAEKVVR